MVCMYVPHVLSTSQRDLPIPKGRFNDVFMTMATRLEKKYSCGMYRGCFKGCI